MTKKLVAVILAFNETDHIQQCIESIRGADEIVVFDSFSEDDTPRLAAEAGAIVIQHPFENYASQRNAALKMVDAEWVLFVDADERVTEALADEIQEVLKSPKNPGYEIPRHNYIFGRLTRYTGWYPDYQMRLLKRDSAHYDPERKVHELVILADNAQPGQLKNPLVHYNYRSLSQFIEKQRRYARFDAKIWFEEGRRPRFRNYILQPLRQFKWRFLTLKGYRDGLHGLRLSVLMAWNEFDKYWQLHRLWRDTQSNTS